MFQLKTNLGKHINEIIKKSMHVYTIWWWKFQFLIEAKEHLHSNRELQTCQVVIDIIKEFAIELITIFKADIKKMEGKGAIFYFLAKRVMTN